MRRIVDGGPAVRPATNGFYSPWYAASHRQRGLHCQSRPTVCRETGRWNERSKFLATRTESVTPRHTGMNTAGDFKQLFDSGCICVQMPTMWRLH